MFFYMRGFFKVYKGFRVFPLFFLCNSTSEAVGPATRRADQKRVRGCLACTFIGFLTKDVFRVTISKQGYVTFISDHKHTHSGD